LKQDAQANGFNVGLFADIWLLAAILKFLCDAYLIRRFETMAQNATE